MPYKTSEELKSYNREYYQRNRIHLLKNIATAIAASYMNIPVAHTQGGEVTGSIDESVRHAVTKLSHIHFPATELARDYLIRMGEDPATVHWTGCPSIDAIASIDLSLPIDIFERYRGVGADLDPSQPYVVVLQAPRRREPRRGRASPLPDQVRGYEDIKLPRAAAYRPSWPPGSDGSPAHRPDHPSGLCGIVVCGQRDKDSGEPDAAPSGPTDRSQREGSGRMADERGADDAGFVLQGGRHHFVPTSRRGTHLSALRLAPPPTMTSSGENSLTTVSR